MVTVKMVRTQSANSVPGKIPYETYEGLQEAMKRYAEDVHRHRWLTPRLSTSFSSRGSSRASYRRSLSLNTERTESLGFEDCASSLASPSASSIQSRGLSSSSSLFSRRPHELKDESVTRRLFRTRHMSTAFVDGLAITAVSSAGDDSEPHHKFAEEFDRNLFLHMGHPLEGKDGNVANNLDILWQIQYALRDLRRYLNSRGDMKLWEYIPCKDPNSVSVERVFAWLASLKYSLKMAPKKPPPTFTAIKSSRKELGAFVKNMTPEMIDCVIKYVDADGNGEIDIAELDMAFRLSRIEIDDCIEVPDGEEMDGSSMAPRPAMYNKTMKLNNSSNPSPTGSSGGDDASSLGGESGSTPAPVPIAVGGPSSLSTTVSVSSASAMSSSVASTTMRSAGNGSTGTTLGSAITAPGASHVSDEYCFFLDNDVLTLLAFMHFDVYDMADIRKATRRVRLLKRMKANINRKASKISSYYQLICERLSERSLHPREWVNREFGEQQLVATTEELRRSLLAFLKGDVPEAFFGADYRLFESDLEEASGYKGQFNTNVLESRLEEALAHLVVVSLSGTLRRPNDDTIAIRQAIDRIESVVYSRYFLRLPEYLKFLDAERTGRLKRSRIKDALIRLSRTPPLNVVAQKLIAEKRAKIRQQEAERRRKDRVFTNKLIKMKNLGVTDVLRKFERFMRERGMRLQDFFNLVDEDRSGRLTPNELMQALLLFANRPDNPQRVHERSRRKAAQHRQEEETHRVEEEHKQFMREMRELEGMGAHSALLKMNKYLRRYQMTLEQVFPAVNEDGDEYVISADEILAHFRKAFVTKAEAIRLYDYCRGRITAKYIEEAARKYARYRRMLKHNTMRTEEDAGLPLFTFEKMMILLRFFFWEEVSAVDFALADLRISLIDFQNAIDYAERRHVISYASEFRSRRYGSQLPSSERYLLARLMQQAAQEPASSKRNRRPSTVPTRQGRYKQEQPQPQQEEEEESSREDEAMVVSPPSSRRRSSVAFAL